MLGAKIDPGAHISLDCELAEFDLVTVGRNAAVELCTLRGFGVDNGAMILGKVHVGEGFKCRHSNSGGTTYISP